MIYYIDHIEAKQIMDNRQDIVILDVREADEYALSHIPNSVLFPLSQLESSEIENRWSKSTCFLIYCRSGRRSKMVAQWMDAKGYKELYEFGGILDWPFETTQDTKQP